MQSKFVILYQICFFSISIMESLKLIILFTVFRWGGRSEGKKVSSSLECSFHVFAKKWAGTPNIAVKDMS